MAGCKYCGDYPEKFVDCVEDNRRYYAGIVTGKKPYLYFEMDSITLNTLFEKEIEIKYCPVCGRKLAQEG